MSTTNRIILCHHNGSVHAVPLQCQKAMMWVMDQIDELNAQLDELKFLMDKTVEFGPRYVECEGIGHVPFIPGAFIRAQGVLRRDSKALDFEIYFSGRNPVINIDVTVGFSDYRIYHENANFDGVIYPLAGLLTARSEEEANALGHFIETQQ